MSLTDDKEKKRALAQLDELEADLFRVAIMQEVCDFKTCRNKYCDTYGCKHFARDWCKEYRDKIKDKNAFCIGFAFRCMKDGKSLSAHSVPMIKKDDKYCLMEPRTNIAVTCWKGTKKGSDILADFPAEAHKEVMDYYDYHGKDCDKKGGKREYFPIDVDLIDYDEKVYCCECLDPKTKKTSIALRLRVPKSLYCRGTCEDKGLELVKRTSCTAEQFLNAEDVKK